MTCNPRGPYWLCHETKRGISSWQGAHQVAQKLSNTTLPRKALRSNFCGLCLCGRIQELACEAKTPPRRPYAYRRFRSTRPGTSPPTKAGQVRRAVFAVLRLVLDWQCIARLSALLNRVPFVHPVGSEVVGEIKNLHMSETQGCSTANTQVQGWDSDSTDSNRSTRR